MTTVRIAHAEPRPGNLGNGSFITHGHLVVLADDAGHRAVPIWMRGEPGESDLAHLIELSGGPADQIVTAGAPAEVTARLLRAAGASVTGVDIDVTVADIDELSPEVTVARIGLGGPAGARQVTASLGLGLAMAAAAGAPVRVADAVMDRVAVPVAGDDLLSPLLDRVPPVGQVRPGHSPAGWPVGTLPGQRPRYEPRNLAFTDGLDRWDLDRGFRREADPSRPQDYSAAADGPSAILSSAVAEPRGSAALVQAIFADDYRGATVAFRGEFRTEDTAGSAGLFLRIHADPRDLRGPRTEHAAADDPDNNLVTIMGHRDWTSREVTARVPDDANIVMFGVFLAGRGRIELRDAELTRSG